MNDKINIDSFLCNNKSKKIVVVQGLGFVGAVMSIVIANSVNDEYAVIGIDLPIKHAVIDQLNMGKFPIECTDPKIYEYFENSKRKNTFYATYDSYAYSKAEIVIVDINLDVEKKLNSDGELESYDVNLEPFKSAIRTIAKKCKNDVLVLIESTVPPGTCQKIIKPIFEEVFNERGLSHDYKIGHSYERVMPGPGYIDSIQSFYRVYSGVDGKSADAIESFLKSIISTEKYPLTRLSSTNATEMSKVLENSFRAMNIAFIQEWTEFAESAGVNLYEVVNAIRMRPTHKNIMNPGLGVGGYCLTKDSLLASWSSQRWFNSAKLYQSEEAVRINDRMPLHTYEVIKNFFNNNIAGKKILIMGISYLQNVGDTRYTPVELLCNKLFGAGVDLVIHDPFIPFWEEKALEISSNDEVFYDTYDAAVIGTPHDYYLLGNKLDEFLARTTKLVVFDPHGALTDEFRKKYCAKHNFIIIGRGDV